jgi:hypothetical protein
VAKVIQLRNTHKKRAPPMGGRGCAQGILNRPVEDGVLVCVLARAKLCHVVSLSFLLLISTAFWNLMFWNQFCMLLDWFAMTLKSALVAKSYMRHFS